MPDMSKRCKASWHQGRPGMGYGLKGFRVCRSGWASGRGIVWGRKFGVAGRLFRRNDQNQSSFQTEGCKFSHAYGVFSIQAKMSQASHATIAVFPGIWNLYMPLKRLKQPVLLSSSEVPGCRTEQFCNRPCRTIAGSKNRTKRQ